MNAAPTATTTCTTRAGWFAGRCADLLERLADFARDAAKAVADMVHETPAAPFVAFTFAFARLAEAATRLIGLSHRLDTGQGFPPPRAARTEPGMPRDSLGLRDPEVRVPFSTLFQLGVPGADVLRDRLAALLAEPEIAEMIATEPAVWRAAAPIARALGLRLAPPPPPPVSLLMAPLAALLPVRPHAPPPLAAPVPAQPGATRVKRRWFHDRKRNKRRPRAG